MPVLEYKVVIVGAVSVGKTSLVNRIHYNQFEEDYQPTIGAGYVPYKTTYDGKDVELQIWDTAGMERYRSLGPIYYRDAVACLIVYDLTDNESAKDVDGWLQSFRMTVKSGAYVVVAGNKADLDNKVVPVEQMQSWCEKNGFDHFITSAKDGTGVSELFQKMVETLVKTQNASTSSPPVEPAAGTSSGCC